MRTIWKITQRHICSFKVNTEFSEKNYLRSYNDEVSKSLSRFWGFFPEQKDAIWDIVQRAIEFDSNTCLLFLMPEKREMIRDENLDNWPKEEINKIIVFSSNMNKLISIMNKKFV